MILFVTGFLFGFSATQFAFTVGVGEEVSLFGTPAWLWGVIALCSFVAWLCAITREVW